jgi:hypothetical protein
MSICPDSVQVLAMALSEISIRHDYTLGDSDGLTLNVTVIGGENLAFSLLVDGQVEAYVLGFVTRISASKKRVPDVTRHAPWLPKASSL